MTNEDLDRVGAAIEAAQCPGREGPYGLYDYTSYGDPVPFHVRDWRDPKSTTWGCAVFKSVDRAEATSQYELLTRRHIAQAAIAAIGWQAIDSAPSSVVVDLFRDGERLVGFQFDPVREHWWRYYGYPAVTQILTKPPTHWMAPPPDPAP